MKDISLQPNKRLKIFIFKERKINKTFNKKKRKENYFENQKLQKNKKKIPSVTTSPKHWRIFCCSS